MDPRAIIVGFVIAVIGWGFYSGFFPNATYSFWLAEAVANGSLFIVLGILAIVGGLLAR